jgi:hypothetical protein
MTLKAKIRQVMYIFIGNDNLKKQQNIIITSPKICALIRSQLINKLIMRGLFHSEIYQLIVMFKCCTK